MGIIYLWGFCGTMWGGGHLQGRREGVSLTRAIVVGEGPDGGVLVRVRAAGGAPLLLCWSSWDPGFDRAPEIPKCS